MQKKGKAVITVIGKDEIGIVSQVAYLLAKSNINILEISQTTMQGVFTMTMLVDLIHSPLSIHELSVICKKLGQKIHQDIYVYDERVVRAMHRI